MSQLLKSNQTLVIKSPNRLIHMLFGHYIMHQICLYMYYDVPDWECCTSVVYTSYFIYFSFNSLVIKNSINNFNSCSLNKNEWLSHLKTQKTPYCMMNISSCPRYAWLQLKPIHLYWIFEVLNYQNW